MASRVKELSERAKAERRSRGYTAFRSLEPWQKRELSDARDEFDRLEWIELFGFYPDRHFREGFWNALEHYELGYP